MSWAGLPAWVRYGVGVLLAAVALVVGVILAVTAWSGTPDRPAAVSGSASTVARDASIVYAEMELAAARAGAVSRSAFADDLPQEYACSACLGSEWFTRWCKAAGGRIVTVSDADRSYFADAGPVYCYPGTQRLPPIGSSRLVYCIEPGRTLPFAVASTICPSGSRLLPDPID